MVADWERARFFYGCGRPVDMGEGVAWFMPLTALAHTPDRRKGTDVEMLRVFLDLTTVDVCYRDGMRSFIAHIRAHHRNPYPSGRGRMPTTAVLSAHFAR